MEVTITRSRLGPFDRPDLVLSLIPGPLLVAALVAVQFGLSLPLALAVGSLPAGLVTAYALFYEPPTVPERPTESK